MIQVDFIPTKKVRPSSLNAREVIDEEALARLAKGIVDHGLLQPIVVRPADGGFEIVAGERRFRAALKAGLMEIPALIRKYSDFEAMEASLVENLHREELSAVEKGRACVALMGKFPEEFPTMAAVARRLGYSQNVVKDWVQLAGDTPRELQKLVGPESYRGRVPEGKIDYRTALTIARNVKDPEKKVQVARAIARDRLRGPRAREIVSRLKKHPQKSVDTVIEEIGREPTMLPFSSKHARDIVRGKKTQTSRKFLDSRIKEGGTVRAAVSYFADLKVTQIERRKLGSFTEEDARREGGYTLEEFRNVWKRLHGKWDPAESVYVLHFSLEKEAPD